MYMSLSNSSHQHFSEPNIPVSVYARYSMDLQRPASIEDQFRNCREGAPYIDAFILNDWLRGDKATSGTMLKGRTGLAELIEVALSDTPPFKGILIDDTSRLGRNLSDTLPLLDKLHHAGIFVHFVTQKLDSRDPNFRQMYLNCGSQDEQYSRQLSKKVHRGQRGVVLNGGIPNGRVYGYVNAEVLDHNRKGKGGRPAVSHIKLDINVEEAQVVTRIFELCAAGQGTTSIAQILNQEGIPSPRLGTCKAHYKWHGQSIKNMLRNTKYRGLHIWNKTTVVYNPNLGRKQAHKRPETEWETVQVPSWRIVSDDLWNAAHHAIEKRRSKFPGCRLGGLSRTEKSRKYLFSGLLECGECGGNFIIIENRKNCERYVCSRGFFRRGGCTARRSFHRRVFESRLVNALLSASDLGLPSEITCALREAEAAELIRRNTSPSVEQIGNDLAELDKQIYDIFDITKRTGTSVPIENHLRDLNYRRAKLADALKSASVPQSAPYTENDIDHLTLKFIEEIRQILTAEPEIAKSALSVLMSAIKITLLDDPEGPFARVETALEFQPGHGRGIIRVPFQVELSTEKERCKVFPREILDRLCEKGDVPVRARDLSGLLGVSRSTLDRWCKKFGAPHIRVGLDVTFAPSEMRAWLLSREAPDSRSIGPSLNDRDRPYGCPIPPPAP